MISSENRDPLFRIVRDQISSKSFSAKYIHIASSTSTPASQTVERRPISFEDTKIELWRNLGDDGVRKAAYRGG
ncbi:hypothetical protein ACVMFA_003230 [Bradyrhizobium liaoningense]|nr:hypothetical protein GCM10007858_54130 [Bradyrhizobium liaoningense]